MKPAAIWIDLENAPHVLFFRPIIEELRGRGIRVIVTARDFGQTVELLKEYSVEAKVIGSGRGSHAIWKSVGILSRVLGLIRFLLTQGPIRLALGHGSRGLVIAAKVLRIPSLTLYDYEGASVRLFNKLSTYVMTPEAIRPERLRALGLDLRKHLTYPGLKENVYLSEETANGPAASDESKVIVLIRPPSATAHYRTNSSDNLFQAILRLLGERENVKILISPRSKEQYAELAALPTASNISIMKEAVDGPKLLRSVDLLIGGGGTMNREAAALGVPVVTIFKGVRGDVDRWLIESGKMHEISEANEVLPFLKKRTSQFSVPSTETKDRIIVAVLRIYNKHSE